MGEASREAGRAALRWWRRWPRWIGYVAAAWALAYGLLGLYWALGGAGFPFGENDPGAALSVVGGAQAETWAPVIAALGLAGAVAAVAMVRTSGRTILRAILLSFAWGAAAALALLIPDYRVLVAVRKFSVAERCERPSDDGSIAVSSGPFRLLVCHSSTWVSRPCTEHEPLSGGHP